MLSRALAAATLFATTAAAPAGFSYTFSAKQEDPADLTTYTFSGYSIGAAPDVGTRRVVVAIIHAAAGTNVTMSSVTIGGVTASNIVNDVSGQRHLSAWAAEVPSGTTADVVATLSASGTRAGCTVYYMTGCAASYSARSGANAGTNTSTTSLATGAVTVPSGGVGFAAAWVGASSPTSGAISWAQTSGTSNERVDELIGESGLLASVIDTTTAGSQDFTATIGSAAQMRVLAFTWAPA